MLHANDQALLRLVKNRPNLKLWDAYGYPFKPTVEILARELKQDSDNVYCGMKLLKSLEKPSKPEGIFSLVDRLTNGENATPFNLPLIKKTKASQIVDAAITEYLALIPQPEYETQHCAEAGHNVLVGKPQSFTKVQLLKILESPVQAMRDLAAMFPDDARASSCNRVAATQDHLRKIVEGHQTEFTIGQLNAVGGAILKDLRTLETELEKHLPEIIAHPAQAATKPERTVIAEIMWGDETPLEKTEWLVSGFLPIGEPAGFTGEMDTRKSTLALDIAAAGSKGRAWFNGAENSHVPFTTLIAATEDSYASTILPRFIAAGGDAKRLGSIPLEIKIEQTSKDGLVTYNAPFSLDEHLDMLADRISAANLTDRGPVKLIIFDPWISFLGNKDANKSQETRVVMAKLKKFLEENRLACINILHYNKTQGINSKQKTGGSSAISEAHRMLWGFMLDEDNKTITNIMPVKKNLLEKATGHRITTVSKAVSLPNGYSDEKGVVKYLGTYKGTADDELQRKEDPERSKKRDVKDAILDELKTGRKEAGQVKYTLKETASVSTIERCSRELEEAGKIRRSSDKYPRKVFWELVENVGQEDLF
jgi:hypothetical protein